MLDENSTIYEWAAAQVRANLSRGVAWYLSLPIDVASNPGLTVAEAREYNAARLESYDAFAAHLAAHGAAVE